MKKELLYYGIGAILLKGMSFFLLPIYASHFSAEEYGILTFLQLFATVVGWFLGLSIFSGMWRYYYDTTEVKKNKLIKSAFGFSLWSNIVILLILFLLVNIPYIRDMGYSNYLYLILGTVFINYFTSQGIGLLRLKREAKKAMLLNLLQAAVQSGFIIFFVLNLKKGIESIFYGQLFASIIVGVVFFVFMKNANYLSLSCSKNVTKKMLKFSIPLIPGSISMWVLNFSDNFFIKYYYTLSDVGIYAFSYKFVSLIQILLIFPVRQSWNPYIFSKIKNIDFVKEKINQVVTIFFAVGLITLLAISIFADNILSFFAKEAYFAGTKIIYVAGLSYILFGACGLMAVSFHIVEKTKLLPKFFTYGALTNIILNFILIKWIGMIGAAVATLISFGVIYMLYIHNVKKYFPLKLSNNLVIIFNLLSAAIYAVDYLFINNLDFLIQIFVKIIELFSVSTIFYLLLKKDNIIKFNLKDIYNKFFFKLLKFKKV